MSDKAEPFRPEFPYELNMAHYFLDARIEEGMGERTAILHRGRRLAYREVQEAANRLAGALVAAGVEQEDRVLVGLCDGPELAAAFFGILKAGAVVTMVNPELPAEDYAYYLDYTRAKVFLGDAVLVARIGPQLCGARNLRAILVGGEQGVAEAVAQAMAGGPRRRALVEAMEAAAPRFTNAPTTRDDPSVWLFTSGSTGKPKAAVHLHHDFPYNTECYAKRVLQMTKDDITLSAPKLFFGYATGTNLLFPFAVGAATALFPEKATPERLHELIDAYRPTVLTSVPTMIGKMLAVPELGARRLAPPLRVTISAGEALPAELYRRWVGTTGCEILDGIGSAELFHIYISNRFGEVKPGTLGRLVPGYEARVVGPDGNEVPPGEIGTLWVKGDSAAVFYWNAHERSKEVLRGDWVVSGDLFRRDAEGFFQYAGRADDMLKVSGIWVSPLEVENVLLSHAAVLECCVVGYDEDGLTKAKAYVVLRDGHEAGAATEASIVEHARERLAHYKVPRRIEVVRELPRSDRGKILRRALRS